MKPKYDKEVHHIIQTLLAQIVDVNNHVRTTQDNKELAESDKLATTNFAHYHLMVLCVLLHELRHIAREKFPDAKGIIDWAENHYQFGLEKKSFTPCKCASCTKEQEQLKKDEEILNEPLLKEITPEVK